MVVNKVLVCSSLGWLVGVGLRGECDIIYSRHPASITVIKGLNFAVRVIDPWGWVVMSSVRSLMLFLHVLRSFIGGGHRLNAFFCLLLSFFAPPPPDGGGMVLATSRNF